MCLFFNTSLSAQSECDFDSLQSTPPTSPEPLQECDNFQVNFQNAPLEFTSVPAKELNVMFHIIGDENGDQNFGNNTQDITFLNELIEEVNDVYKTLDVPDPWWGDVCNPDSKHIIDNRISFQLTDIQFYTHSDLYCKFSSSSGYDYCVTNNSNLSNEEKQNNIHIIIYAYKNCSPPDYTVYGVGYRRSDFTKVAGYYNFYERYYLGDHLAHELGHVLGLWHSWQFDKNLLCDLNDSRFESNNIMDNENHPKGQAFTHRQIGKMHCWIENEEGQVQPYLSNDLCDKQETEIVIPSGEEITWNSHEIVSEDVHTYGILTLTCNVEVAREVSFIVHEDGKLVVDGALMTSHCDEWNGIEVYGGSPNYAVEIINGATIENTHHAAVSMFGNHGATLLGDGNAHVLIENANFHNCTKMLEMGSRKQLLNYSRVFNTTHNGGAWGISNWNCLGVEVIDNQFTNIEYEGIVTEQGSFTISGNNVESARNDILFANVYTGHGTIVDHNVFNGENTGVRGIGSTLGVNHLHHNQFNNNNNGIFMDGENRYIVNKNDFIYSFRGLVGANNGPGLNKIKLNELDYNYIGLVPIGKNTGLLFIENCFNTLYADSYITGQVATAQVKLNRHAANNCFTSGGNPNHPIYDMTGNPDPFVYYEPGDNTIDCRDATKAHPNILRLQIGIEDEENCDEAGSGTPIPPVNDPCNPEKDYTSIKNALKAIQTAIDDIQNSSELTEQEKQEFIALYKKCIQNIKRIWVELKMEEEDHQELRDSLMTNENETAALMIYSSFMSEAKYDSAKQYLNTIIDSTQALSDFVTTQLINLKRDKYDSTTVVSSSDITTIENIAKKDHLYAGYAKALYYWLTNNIIATDLPASTHAPSEPRAKIYSKDDRAFNVYPNPTNGLLNIDVDDNGENYLYVSDLQGKILLGKTFTESCQINTSEWRQGLFIVNLKTKDKPVERVKVLVLH